jgi:hypothetical protein
VEDFFVNGLSFNEELRIFIGLPSKNRLMSVLEQYHGRMGKTRVLSWRKIIKMSEEMFSNDRGSENLFEDTKWVTFYGNDGVCLFKYFVNETDPQKAFVWTVLLTNFLCFSLILISYSLIAIESKMSSNAVGDRVDARKRNLKLQRKITLIIMTDFCSWIPFIVVCSLHYFNVINATPWYSLFSMIVLPINSVINPLLYNTLPGRLLYLVKLNVVRSFSRLSKYAQTSPSVSKDGNQKFELTVKDRINDSNELNDHHSQSETCSNTAREASL